jgi:adenosylhomocysteine nucleosidase
MKSKAAQELFEKIFRFFLRRAQARSLRTLPSAVKTKLNCPETIAKRPFPDTPGILAMRLQSGEYLPNHSAGKIRVFMENSPDCSGADLLICFAVKEEAGNFQRLTGPRPRIKVVLTGMGQRNAEKAIRSALAAERPRLVLSSGFAGGLNPRLATGTVVFAADQQPHLASELLAAGAQPARFYSAERVVSTAEQKRALWQATASDAVEMESQIICAVCGEKNISSATVRVVLDTSDEDLPLDFNQLMTADQRLDKWKLALTLMKSPAKIGALLRLQRRTRAAAARLAEVLDKVTTCPGSQSRD